MGSKNRWNVAMIDRPLFSTLLSHSSFSAAVCGREWRCLGRTLTEKRARKCINETEGEKKQRCHSKRKGMKMSGSALSWKWKSVALHRSVEMNRIIWDYKKIIEISWESAGSGWSLWDCKGVIECVCEREHWRKRALFCMVPGKHHHLQTYTRL